MCFGGIKNGAGIGEAVVFFDMKLAEEFDYRCKQAGQLASKMRYLSAPWVGLLKNDTWLKNAAHANAMAARLERGLNQISGIKMLFARQANAVFAEIPAHAVDALWKSGWLFYTFIGQGGCRLMCAWDTTEADVHAFLAELKSAL